MHGDSSSAGRARVDEPDPAELPTSAAELEILLLPDGRGPKRSRILTSVRAVAAHMRRT
jgi:hypothetical protein